MKLKMPEILDLSFKYQQASFNDFDIGFPPNVIEFS